MITNIKENLAGIVIGIRYRANFFIEDQLGKIIDQILYQSTGYFSMKYFPLVYSNIKEKVLIDEERNNHLTINNSNIILNLNFGDQLKASDYEGIVTSFRKEIIENVLIQFKITEISRIGFVNKYSFSSPGLAKEFVNKTVGTTIDGVNDINVRFSKKIPATEAMIKKSVYDYYNIIYTIIKEANKEELHISIDYQKYFEPFLPSAAEIPFNEFVKKVNNYNSNLFPEWLNRNYGKQKS
ncbi:MAG: hypothetical protein WA440_05880 [Ignavibacteriaceae bacterium]